MAEREINPHIVGEVAHVIGCGRDQAERAIRLMVRLAKVRGLYSGEYEKPSRYLSPPEFVGRNGRIPKYPFYKMEVGESVAFGYRDKTAALDAARSYGKRHGIKFTHAPDGDGVRVWRVS